MPMALVNAQSYLPSARGLGLCIQCRNELCVRGDEIQCIRCGLPVLDHPEMARSRELQRQAEAARKNPSRPVVIPTDYPGGDRDRLNAVERENKALRERMAAMERQLATAGDDGGKPKRR